MATGKSYFSRSKCRFLPAGDGPDHRRTGGYGDAVFELDESDLFNSGASPEFRRSVSKTRVSKRISAVDGGDRSLTAVSAASLPVNIPDWSKILRNEYIENRRNGFDDEDEEEDEDGGGGGDDFEEGRFRVPPHEFLARTRMASFSVHEGIGRTLKGRDLSRVRNAIWQKTGFED